MTSSWVYTFTLSTGDVVAIYRSVSAGEVVIAIGLLLLLILAIVDLVRTYA
jgi:hypothetical protein